MLQRDHSVVFLSAYPDGCALWRCYIPHFNIPNAAFWCFANKPDFARITGCDIAVVQRCCTPEQLNFVKICKVLGIKVIYDLDDDVWDLPPYNPAMEMFNKLKAGFNECIKMADVLTVSTQRLAKVAKRNVGNLRNTQTNKEIPIIVVENRIDERLFVAPIKSERVTVGWAGSSSHVGDLLLVENAVKTLAYEHGDVEFEFRGCEAPAGLTKWSNVNHKYWTPVAEYGNRMPVWGWHIALAPVTTHPFNDSKSCLKQIEAGYCNIPCLASEVEPYIKFCMHDTELNWLLCNTRSAWERKLRDLINDVPRRLELGNKMKAVVDKHYSFNKPHEGWLEAIKVAKEI